MTAFVDTNVLIRHLTGAPPRPGSPRHRLSGRRRRIAPPDLIVAEVVYVLDSFYEVPADEVARLVRSVIAYPPIRTLDPALLLRSLEVYEIHRIDFAEAYLVASAEASGVPDIISFDLSIDRVTTANRIEP